MSPFSKYLRNIEGQRTLNTIELMSFAKDMGVDLTEDELLDYGNMIYDAMQSNRNCSFCSGLDNCKSNPSGMQYIIEVGMGSKIYPSYRMCCYKMAEVSMQRINRLMRSSRLPDHFKTKTFANYRRQENGEAYMAAMRVANEQNGKGLLMYGPPGTGKTHLAAAIANDRLSKGNEVVFATVPELMADIRAVIGKNENTSELMELVKTAELLILDDMGAERMTLWVAEQLFSIINARLLNCKQTVVTTNYDPSELIVRMAVRDRSGNIEDDIPGRRIVSRLMEMCQKVKIDGKDQRLKGAV